MAEPPLPLEGIRVVDLATLIAAPTCGKYLADFGADVVKVERPDGGDPIRAWHFHKDGVSLWWKCVSRNKRPVTLNIKHPRGLEVARRLLARADVLLENFRPGTLERLGRDPAERRVENPGLVVLRNSGFGQDGPNAGRPGFGTLAEAFSGYADLTGYEDRPPLLPPIALADEVLGLFGAMAVMIALYHRDVHDAPGQVVDLALYESLFALLGPLPTVWDQLGRLQERQGSRIAYTAPRNTYGTADGRCVALSGSSQTVAERVFAAIERPELAQDPRFATNAARVANVEALDEAIGDWIGRHSLDEVVSRFEECEAALAPAHDMAGIFADAHYAARGAVARVSDDELGEVAMQGVFPRLSDTPGRIRHAGLPAGSCTSEVLADLGYSPEEVADLRRDGAI